MMKILTESKMKICVIARRHTLNKTTSKQHQYFFGSQILEYLLSASSNVVCGAVSHTHRREVLICVDRCSQLGNNMSDRSDLHASVILCYANAQRSSNRSLTEHRNSLIRDE